MSRPLPWTPWHRVVQIRDDLRSGELSLAVFAADLYDVTMGKARSVYQNPHDFFALTYPTFNLRELARDVVGRLAGKNSKAVRQLELTYGGGKTHTLITLFHLVNDPAGLPDLPAVQEFIQHIGLPIPKARIAVLAFDKLDVEKGMEVKSPDGSIRWLKNPWSVLAFQLAGAEGLRLLHAEDRDDERDSAPAENLLESLFSIPGEKEDCSTLILIDEALMYARERIGLDPAWRGKLINFFQYLTQAATKVDRCAIVASLLATDPRKSDSLGKEITQELYAIFRREREEGVQPVAKEDVAEVLRRRFFSPESIRDREAFRPHVVAALKGIAAFDEQTRKDGKMAEERFLKSYPFHPDLTEVFYTKWTNMEGFQRTRGVLRTFALALRDAEKWDECPLIAANVFLGGRAGSTGIGEAARELTTIAATEEYEGKKQEWTGILEGELAKACQIQTEVAGVMFREVEQAVLATFLHSQPIGHRALRRELMLLLGATRPDKIELEKALHRWTEVSWFLDEGAVNDADIGPDGQKQLPKSWRLGSRPNLKQMHHDACIRVPPEMVEDRLLKEISRLKSLTAGASAAGAKVHMMPVRPKEIEDDGEFHYAVLGPKTVSDPGKPNPVAVRFIEETTAASHPRKFRNALVLVVPSRDGLDIACNAIREYLGWEEVRSQLKGQDIDPVRSEVLSANIEAAQKKIPDAIRQAYCIAVTVSDKNEVQALKVSIDDRPLFTIIKDDKRSRIQDTLISADALLPDGPYNLWREGETSRWVKDLVGSFAQFPHLPKMLRQKEILGTLALGAREGFFVLQTTRPDRSVKTFWRQEPDEASLKDPGLEVVLPEAAMLTEISPALLSPGVLPGLWDGAGASGLRDGGEIAGVREDAEITIRDVYGYFSGGHVVKIRKSGYEEPITIPGAEKAVVDAAIGKAIQNGSLWLICGPSSLWAEEVPPGLLTEEARLQGPPPSITAMGILPANLPQAWSTLPGPTGLAGQPGAGSAQACQTSTACAISNALADKAGKPYPWRTVREAIDGAIRARLLELTLDSGPWPCGYSEAQKVKLRIPGNRQTQAPAAPSTVSTSKPPIQPPDALRPGAAAGEAELKSHEIQDLAEIISDLVEAAVGYDLKFRLRIELGGDPPPSAELVKKVNEILAGISKNIQLR
ncbi:MAG: DUF499 domain-containing protein [bacterium]